MRNLKNSIEFDRKAFGEKVRAGRTALGVTQEEFAERINRDTSYVSHIERGSKKANPTAEVIIDIANGLGLGLDYLLGDSLLTVEKLIDNDVFLMDILKYFQSVPEDQQANLLTMVRTFAAACGK